MEKALNIQIGGLHYKSFPYQPIVLSANLGLNYFQGAIAKYIVRDKGDKIQDINKAIHYCQLAIELDQDKYKKKVIDADYIEYLNKELDEYIITPKQLPILIKDIMFMVGTCQYKEAIKLIKNYKRNDKRRINFYLSDKKR